MALIRTALTTRASAASAAKLARIRPTSALPALLAPSFKTEDTSCRTSVWRSTSADPKCTRTWRSPSAQTAIPNAPLASARSLRSAIAAARSSSTTRHARTSAQTDSSPIPELISASPARSAPPAKRQSITAYRAFLGCTYTKTSAKQPAPNNTGPMMRQRSAYSARHTACSASMPALTALNATQLSSTTSSLSRCSCADKIVRIGSTQMKPAGSASAHHAMGLARNASEVLTRTARSAKGSCT